MLNKNLSGAAKLRSVSFDHSRKPGLPNNSHNIKIEVVSAEPEASTKRNSKFPTFGAFLQAVAKATIERPTSSSPLVRNPSGANETDPTAGGFMVESQWASELIGSIYEEATLAPLCDRRESDKPSDWKLPAVDEISRADGSRWGGTLSYWTGESVQPTGSLPRYKQLNFTGHRLIALCTVTNELLADAPLLAGHVRRAFASETSFKLDLAILRGSGAGLPLGIVGAPGTIQVARAVGQAPGTIIAENIASMWSRCASPCRKRAVWIVNEDAEQQLNLIGSGGGAASTNGMFYPQGHSGNEFALVCGRPVIVSECAAPLGTPGDIVLADLSQYIVIDGGLQTAISMEVAYDTDESVFRFRWRGDGKPGWQSPITPYNGGATRSPFVTLAQR